MQQITHFGACCGGCGARHGGAWAHDQVDARECIALRAKHFPRHAFTIISGNRPRHYTLADDDAEARLGDPVGLGVNLEQLTADPAFVSEHGRKSIRTGEPGRPGEWENLARATQMPRRARPLARRARTTARPPRVFMRTRKPCVRLRRVVDG